MKLEQQAVLTGAWLGAMLGHSDPRKFPSLEEVIGEKKTSGPVAIDPAEARSNAAAWFAVLQPRKAKLPETPTDDVE